MVFATNSKVRDCDTWMCLDPVVIPALEWYRMSLWIKLEAEPPIMVSGPDLAQSREGCRFHDDIYTPIYGKM